MVAPAFDTHEQVSAGGFLLLRADTKIVAEFGLLPAIMFEEMRQVVLLQLFKLRAMSVVPKTKWIGIPIRPFHEIAKLDHFSGEAGSIEQLTNAFAWKRMNVFRKFRFEANEFEKGTDYVESKDYFIYVENLPNAKEIEWRMPSWTWKRQMLEKYLADY